MREYVQTNKVIIFIKALQGDFMGAQQSYTCLSHFIAILAHAYTSINTYIHTYTYMISAT